MKKSMLKLSFALVTTSLIFLAACGDDSNDNNGTSSGGFSTGLPKDKKLKDLTEAENKKAEDAAEKSFNNAAFQSNSCYSITAYSLAFTIDTYEDEEQLRAACTESYNECVTSEDENSSTGGFPENCEATIGELETCVPGYFANIEAKFKNAIPCDSLTFDHVENFDESVLTPPELTPACQIIEDKCPGFFSGTDE